LRELKVSALQKVYLKGCPRWYTQGIYGFRKIRKVLPKFLVPVVLLVLPNQVWDLLIPFNYIQVIKNWQDGLFH